MQETSGGPLRDACTPAAYSQQPNEASVLPLLPSSACCPQLPAGRSLAGEDSVLTTDLGSDLAAGLLHTALKECDHPGDAFPARITPRIHSRDQQV